MEGLCGVTGLPPRCQSWYRNMKYATHPEGKLRMFQVPSAMSVGPGSVVYLRKPEHAEACFSGCVHLIKTHRAQSAQCTRLRHSGMAFACQCCLCTSVLGGYGFTQCRLSGRHACDTIAVASAICRAHDVDRAHTLLESVCGRVSRPPHHKGHAIALPVRRMAVRGLPPRYPYAAWL